eukprot:8164472-Lingulodinium_polyedra.AAC.1
MTRSNRRFPSATARELHARALHAHTHLLACAWSAKRACLGAAWVLLKCCLGAAWELHGSCFGGDCL